MYDIQNEPNSMVL